MSYLATGDTGYRLDANGKCVNAMNQAVDKSLCAPQEGFLSSIWSALQPKTDIRAIPVPTSSIKAVKFVGSTKSSAPASLSKPTESWGDKLLKGLDIATKVSALNQPAVAPPSSGMPGWVVPVALGGGVLVLVLALTRK